MAEGIFLFIAGMAAGIWLMWAAEWVGETIFYSESIPDKE